MFSFINLSLFSGDYVCQISDKQNKDQVHTVEILGKSKQKKNLKEIEN